MKTLNKEEIEAAVAGAFEAYPDAKKVFATSDGNTFLVENHAKLHAGPKGKVYTYERDSETESEKGKDVVRLASAKDVIKAIEGAQTIDELFAHKDDTRKTVKEAFDKKAAEFDKPTEDLDFEVTQEHLDANPDLVEQGIKVGDLIKAPNIGNN